MHKVSICGAEAVKQAERFEVLTFIIKTANHSIDFRDLHLAGLVAYESIIRGGEGSWETPCATMPSGCGDTPADTQTVPDCWGQCGRVNRSSGRSLPSSPLPSAWGTTVTATHNRRRGSGNGLRFAFAWVAYESIIRGWRGQRNPLCATLSTVT